MSSNASDSLFKGHELIGYDESKYQANRFKFIFKSLDSVS